MEVRKIKTGPGLEFECSAAGAPDGIPVLLPHGFGVSRHFWDRQILALAEAGYFAIAPNQRSYSADARTVGISTRSRGRSPGTASPPPHRSVVRHE
jgi:pimeloyl-ACP methyl ester carboxylesterase